MRAMMDDGLSEAEARKRFFLVDRDGLLVEDTPHLLPFQKIFAQPRKTIKTWVLENEDEGKVGLGAVIRNARPTVLIGVSGQPGAFAEQLVRSMAASVERPIIFPLSNPTSQAEATPADLTNWTDGRAVIGFGSPFPPFLKEGSYIRADQANNSYVFPGIGLGAIAVSAKRISDNMLMAAARALAEVSPARLNPSANLLPPVTELRDVSIRVAQAVANQACKEGLAEATHRDDISQRIHDKIWSPMYRPYRRMG